MCGHLCDLWFTGLLGGRAGVIAMSVMRRNRVSSAPHSASLCVWHYCCAVIYVGWRGAAPDAHTDGSSLEIFDDGSMTMQSELSVAGSATLSSGLTVHGEAMHHGGLTLMPPPAGAASPLAAPAGVVSASSVGPAGRKVSLFRVVPQPVLSADDDSGGGECARWCGAIARSAVRRSRVCAAPQPAALCA